MLAKACSGTVYGVDAFPVDIEVNAGLGDPSVVIVGLPDAAVKESKDRVHTALLNSGYKPHIGRVTINLAPADMRKEGPLFDLPIALGLLAAKSDLPEQALDGYAMVGELALSGEVRRVRGVLPIAMCARDNGLKGLLVPEENAEEAAVVEGLAVFPVRTLRQAAEFLGGTLPQTPFRIAPDRLAPESGEHEDDYADVKGQELARRALEVAVAGGHNLLMIGPPGSGKTMLARRISTILPAMTLEESLEATRIHSIAGTLPAHAALIARRPFRAPHHTISDAGLLGGGTHPLPGEVSLAHRGVLFLDELPEFHRHVLEVMRQPLEDGAVTIARAAATVTFPCQFMLVAAMNPCPCGYFGDPKRECRCSDRQIQLYRNKISGPLLDRIDIHVEVPAVRYQELTSLQPGESSAAIRARVLAARDRQRERFKGLRKVHCNAGMGARAVQRLCPLAADATATLREAVTFHNFSARAYDRILKVARTIADLAGGEAIEVAHIHEAVQYRTLDRQLWR